MSYMHMYTCEEMITCYVYVYVYMYVYIYIYI